MTINTTTIPHVDSVEGFRRSTGKTYTRPERAEIVVLQGNGTVGTGDVIEGRPCTECGGWYPIDGEHGESEVFGSEVNPRNRTGDWYATLFDEGWQPLATGKAEYLDGDRVRVAPTQGDLVTGVRWVAVDKPYDEADYQRNVIAGIMYTAKDYGYTQAVEQMTALLAEQAPHLLPNRTLSGRVMLTVGASSFRVDVPRTELGAGQTEAGIVDAWVAENFPTAVVSTRDYAASMVQPSTLEPPSNPSAHHRKVMAAIQRVGTIFAKTYNMCSVFEDTMRRHGMDPDRAAGDTSSPVTWKVEIAGRYTVDLGGLLPEDVTLTEAYVVANASFEVEAEPNQSSIRTAAGRKAGEMGFVSDSISLTKFTPSLSLF